MSIYNYVACFFAGVFICNFFPHFIKGVTGEKFPTPFAKPPIKGLSKPYVNILWALFNLLVGIILIWVSDFSLTNFWCILLAFLGFALTGIGLSITAEKKHDK